MRPVQERHTAGTMLLRGWRMKNDARDCPQCGCTIPKSEGCDHMNCKGLWSTYLLNVHVRFEEGVVDVRGTRGVFTILAALIFGIGGFGILYVGRIIFIRSPQNPPQYSFQAITTHSDSTKQTTQISFPHPTHLKRHRYPPHPFELLYVIPSKSNKQHLCIRPKKKTSPHSSSKKDPGTRIPSERERHPSPSLPYSEEMTGIQV